MKWPVPKDELWPPPGVRTVVNTATVLATIGAALLRWPLMLLVVAPVAVVLAMMGLIGSETR